MEGDRIVFVWWGPENQTVAKDECTLANCVPRVEEMEETRSKTAWLSLCSWLWRVWVCGPSNCCLCSEQSNVAKHSAWRSKVVKNASSSQGCSAPEANWWQWLLCFDSWRRLFFVTNPHQADTFRWQFYSLFPVSLQASVFVLFQRICSWGCSVYWPPCINQWNGSFLILLFLILFLTTQTKFRHCIVKTAEEFTNK